MFTGRFPFGEAVLRGEIEVTAPRFGRVFVVPSRSGPEAAELPPNAELVDLGWGQGWPSSARWSALRSRSALRVLGRTLRQPSNWRAYAGNARVYRSLLAEGLLRARSIEAWAVENDLRDAVFYDFWFENSTLALAVLKDRGVIRCAVSRAHGFDLFDSRWGGSARVPFREFKAEHLDAVFAISEDGAGYLRGKLGADAGKVRLARLGIPAPRFFPQGRADPPLVVSCALMRPDKRVHEIPDVLRACDRPLRWVHFGDGPERPRVEAAAASLPDRVTWELRGRVENAAVREFYATEPVSAFLSLSRAEGVPVSMMEVQSAGVPIVALAVGGVPEIVQPETGMPLPPGSSTGEIAAALAKALDPAQFDADRIRSSFASRFDASTNYREFADALLGIWSDDVAGG